MKTEEQNILDAYNNKSIRVGTIIAQPFFGLVWEVTDMDAKETYTNGCGEVIRMPIELTLREKKDFRKENLGDICFQSIGRFNQNFDGTGGFAYRVIGFGWGEEPKN